MPDLTAVKTALKAQRIELPSWAFGNTGTRFKVFAQPGVPRTPLEKIDDAAQVHRFTGVAPERGACTSRGTRSDDYAALAEHAADAGVRIGTVNANVFQDDDYRLGSVCQPRPPGAPQGRGAPAGVRRHHGRDRVPRPEAVVRRRHQLPRPGRHPRPPGPAGGGAGRRCTQRLGPGQRMLLEYKLFEPSFYTTDVPDWGTVAAALPGPRAAGRGGGGHRPPRAGHEHRVHRGRAAAGRAARRLRLQQPLLRRRRPDGRRGRPVPAVPHPARGGPGRGRAAARQARASRSCSTSATTSSPRSRPRSAR